MKLYHYVHCPFCVRVRMALGRLNVEYESHVLPYDDEQTPNQLCQKKMLPIFQWKDADQINESLEIIKRLDAKDDLKTSMLENSSYLNEVEELLQKIGSPVHNLAMPYWVLLPEFNASSRRYFIEKKSKKRGPFHLLVQNKQQYLDELTPVIQSVQSKVSPFYLGEVLSIFDLMIASHLWGLYIVPEFQFPIGLHKYLQTVSRICHFNYLEDFWKEDPLTNKNLI